LFRRGSAELTITRLAVVERREGGHNSGYDGVGNHCALARTERAAALFRHGLDLFRDFEIGLAAITPRRSRRERQPRRTDATGLSPLGANRRRIIFGVAKENAV